MAKLALKDVDVSGKRVLMRVDYNVPLDDTGKITDDTRIRATLPSVNYVIENTGKLVLMAHLGRPKGKVKSEFSLKPAAERLSELIGRPVVLAPDCVGDEVEKIVSEMSDGDVVLLENVRFHPEEEANEIDFATKMARLGDIYVNDAFGAAHRAHASTEGVTKHIDQSAAGFLMEKELQYLGTVLENPERPFVAVMGGAKISGKIDAINNLLPKVDTLIIGGGMAYTFFKAMGLEIGKSLLEVDRVEMAAELLKTAGDKIMLPLDIVVADGFDNEAQTQEVAYDAIPADWEGLDSGPATIEKFGSILKEAKTIVWNGPMGVFEMPSFARGTYELAEAAAVATAAGATSVIGGGDTASAIKQSGCAESMSHISTGGGASLEFMEGKVLPGVDALTDA
jgi:phosphoglycerate kinase